VTSCTNTVTPDKSALTFKITGTAPKTIDAGKQVVLGKQSWEVTVPGSTLQAGVNLDLLAPGDTVGGTVTPKLFGSNTAEGSVAGAGVPVTIGPIQVDGAGMVLPATTTFSPANTSWTAVGGDVAYSMDTTTFLLVIGPLKIGFTCTPDDTTKAIVTTTVVGQTDIPAAGRDPAPAATATVAGVTTTSTTGGTLPVTGSSSLMVQIALALILIDGGYMLLSATKPARRRPRPGEAG
jgi:hypothetical protein